uniref:DUF6598 domain-containing protein n=1 Tax=Arundo donax TaxID=35708 RepID=A0A0A8XWM3_ARUDO
MEVAVEAANGSSWEGKASEKNQRLSEKKPFRRFEQEGSAEEEEERLLDEEEGDMRVWLSYSRYYERYINHHYGSCEDTTSVRPMRYTKGPIPSYACCDHALQIFSVQVMEAKDGLEWPLHVYGWVATRDSIDRKRNFLFNRTRDNCQILTQQDSYLLLTGPSRAVVLIDPVTFQVELKVKVGGDFEDKLLSLKVFEHHKLPPYQYKPCLIHKRLSSKRSMIEVTYATFYETVEASVVSVQVTDGSWPDHLRGRVVCRTTGIEEGDIVLLDSRDGRMPLTCDGAIELSRHVFSAELRRPVKIDVVASQVSDNTCVAAAARAVFRPKKARSSHGTCDLGFCKVEITVAWSLLSWN